MSDILYPRELGKASVVTLEDAIAYLEEKWHGGGGGSSNILKVNVDDNGTLDKTWQEIADADYAVFIDRNIYESEGSAGVYWLTAFWTDGDMYYVGATSSADYTFATDSPDGYPVNSK